MPTHNIGTSFHREHMLTFRITVNFCSNVHCLFFSLCPCMMWYVRSKWLPLVGSTFLVYFAHIQEKNVLLSNHVRPTAKKFGLSLYTRKIEMVHLISRIKLVLGERLASQGSFASWAWWAQFCQDLLALKMWSNSWYPMRVFLYAANERYLLYSPKAIRPERSTHRKRIHSSPSFQQKTIPQKNATKSSSSISMPFKLLLSNWFTF